MRQFGKQPPRVKLLSDPGKFGLFAGGRFCVTLARIAHALRHGGVSEPPGRLRVYCRRYSPAICSAIAIPSHAMRWYGAFELQLVKCMIRHQHCASRGEPVHREPGQT